MIWRVLIGAVAFVVILAALAVMGRRKFVVKINDNVKQTSLVREFHQGLVAYANSGGRDNQAYTDLAMKSSSVESALGYDNYVNGVRVGNYLLNNATILPLAIQEMPRLFGDHLFQRDGFQVADALQTVLFRHIGRRQQFDEHLREESSNLIACIVLGWSTFTAIPIAIVEAFGLISRAKSESARGSILFKLWSLLLALAAFAGPIFAYIVDKGKIDAAIRSLWP